MSDAAARALVASVILYIAARWFERRILPRVALRGDRSMLRTSGLALRKLAVPLLLVGTVVARVAIFHAPEGSSTQSSPTQSELPIVSGAATTASGYVACATEDLLEQFGNLVAAEHDGGVGSLADGNGCFFLKSGLKASVLESGWTGSVRIRLRSGGKIFEVWTSREALVRDDWR